MKKSIALFLSLFVQLSWAQQNNVQVYNGSSGWTTSKKSKAQQQKIQNVAPYDTIAIEGNFEVTLYEGEEGTIELSGPSILIEEVEVKSNSKGLTIKYPNWRKLKTYWPRNSAVKIRIPVTAITKVSLSGSGHIKADYTMPYSPFKSQLSGSGSMEFSLSSKNTTAQLSGSGSIVLKGESENIDLKISGSGSINSQELISQSAITKISGSGSIKVHATQSISSNISGSGRVNVYGNPQETIDLSNSGSGKTTIMRP